MDRKQILAAAVLALALAFGLVGVVLGQCGPGGCPGGACPTPQPWQGSQLWRPSPPAQPTRPAIRAPDAVVRVTCGESGGSATIIHVDEHAAYVLSCWHLLRDGGQVRVHTNDGRGYIAKTLVSDKLWDVSLFAIQDPGIKPIRLAVDNPAAGSAIFLSGFGNSSQPYRSAPGKLLGWEPPHRERGQGGSEMMKVSAIARDGDSGGPIFNSTGQIVGVVSCVHGEDGGFSCGTVCGRINQLIRQFCGDDPPTRLPPAPLPTPPLVAVTPPPPVRPPPVADPCVILEATVIALEAEIVALRAQVANLATSVAACEQTPGLPAAPGPQGPPGKDAVVDYDMLITRLPPIYVKKVNTLTGEETVEEVHLGEGLIFQLTPHQ